MEKENCPERYHVYCKRKRHAFVLMKGNALVERFTVDETATKSWLAAVLATNDRDDPDADETPDDPPRIDDNWKPRDLDEEDRISRLMQGAFEHGAITGPEGATIKIEFSTDHYDTHYRWLIALAEPLIVASPSKERRHIGNGQARGIDAAVIILTEAADAANTELGLLEAYVNTRRGAVSATPIRHARKNR